MARYRKIDPRIWNDEKFRALSDHGKLAFLFLLTHPHMTALGAMRASVAGLAEELGWGTEAFREAFAEALQKGMAEHDPKACLIALPKFIRYNSPESPNVVKAWVSALDLLPECTLKNRTVARAKAFAEALPKAFGIAFAEAFAKGMPYQEQEQEPEQEQEKSPTPAPVAPAAQLAPMAAGIGGNETALQAACKETWASYSMAYVSRYGTEPVRNAKVNTNVKQFVQRLGAAEAPMVAEWFLSHPGAYYIQKCHDFGALLADAEKLRTEWATGKVVTLTHARQSDKTGTMKAAVESLLAEAESGRESA